MKEGMIYVFTGEGKGKTSAALGVAVRSALSDKQVSWIAWYKELTWATAERELPKKIKNIEVSLTGRGFMIENPETIKGGIKIATVGKSGKVIDRATESEHRAAAESALDLAKEKLASGRYFLVVLDEILNAVADGLLQEEMVKELLHMRGETHVVMTGRGVTPGVIKIADLVTECRKIKHPYDRGELAVRGLDY